MFHPRFLILLLLTISLESCQSETPATNVIKRRALVEDVSIEALNHLGNTWQVVTVDPAMARPSIRHSDEAGKPLRDFAVFNQAEKKPGKQTVWMMNAGMYHKNGLPVGLCICDGNEVGPVHQSNGTGNFFLKPNGIFFLTDKKAGVIDTIEWDPAIAATILCATQSGPLLVRRGQLHPAIRPSSPNKLIRNGVGVRSDGHLCFVISTTPVSFHDMALFFRNHLKCPDALYLDGTVSNLYARMAPTLGRDEISGFTFFSER
jgi:uncharacterized protein YigE (DUF2233 family)